MTARRTISAKERLRLFQLHGGICHLCNGRIQVGEAWEVSHDIPLELLGADDDANRLLAHKKCHRARTSTVDQPNIARAKRRERKHLGIKKPGRGFYKPPGTEYDWSRGKYVKETT